MVDQGQDKQYDLNLLRGWKRDQLKLLKEFTLKPIVSQSLMSTASGATIGSHELGGKITALTRANLIEKVGRDEDGSFLWRLNESVVDKNKLKEFLVDLDI